MIRSLQPLESNLDDLLIRKAPPLPVNGKKTLVQYLPLITLILGILTAYDAWVLWHWAHDATALIMYANRASAAYGGPLVITNRMGIGIWVGLVVLLIEAGVYFSAFSATQDRQRSGWELLFYAALLNVAYEVAVLFSNYGSLGGLLGGAIGSVLGLYLLFQIRDDYLKQPTIAKRRRTPPKRQ